jgi:ATP-dependent helicase/nuclease subunit B
VTDTPPRSFLDAPGPRVFTLPPRADFADALARGLRNGLNANADPARLADALILTPTRRAARLLGDAFARSAESGVALLPAIRPIGDVDVDEPPFEPGELGEIAPAAISGARRRFELARLVLAKEAALGRELGLAGALALADPLGRLLDDLATDEAGDLSLLREEIQDHLPMDRREAAEFLAIIEAAWPARLAELGLVDPARRRSLILRALAERWTETPPDMPVIAAGSTGSIPAARRLLSVIARAPQGAVILPGLDWDADEEAWRQVDDSHPQWAMKATLKEIGVAPSAVPAWPGAAEGVAARGRRRVIAEALRPAETTSDWLRRVEDLAEANGPDFLADGLKGLSLIEAPDPGAEARAIALLLRETLETPEATALLVTPDRALARRVIIEMRRYGVVLDDSAGVALSETPAGAFLAAILDAALDPGSVVALRALTGSPLFALGRERSELRRRLAHIDRQAWRGVRPGSDWAALKQPMEAAGHHLRPADKEWGGALLDGLAEALIALTGAGAQQAADWARAHAIAAERLADTVEQDGSARVWSGEDGEAAAALIGDFLREADALPPMSLFDYAGALAALSRTRRVRPRYPAHARLRVLGPLEARLQSADRVILAGLNEGVWPAGTGQDPYMSRGMRQAAGLAAPEQRYGLAAHDFAQLAAGREVILTRAEKADGAPTTASRWIWRLNALTRGALGAEGAKAALAPSADYLALAASLDEPTAASRIEPPAPRPPVEARPRVLSVTDIEKWVRDPFHIYARRVLNLAKLDPPDAPPGPRERGDALHLALEEFFKRHPSGPLPDAGLVELVARGEAALRAAGFSEAETALERQRLARAAAWALDWEARRRAAGVVVHGAEVMGEWRIDAPGGDFVLKGRADRIDRLADGRLEPIDYKTGEAPSKKATEAGFAPQLPLIAAMLEAGAYDGIAAAPSARLTYLKLGGGKPPGEEKGLPTDGLAAQYAGILKGLIARYDRAETAYPSQPRAQYVNPYGDYDHLARRKEWTSAGGEE